MKKILLNHFPIVLVIFSVSLLQGLQQCVSPVLSQISEHYPQINVSFVQMLVTAPLIAAIFSSLFSGVMVLRVSKKQLLLLAALLAGVVGLLPFLSDSFVLLFISRILYGFSMGLCMALNAAVVADFFQGKERTFAMGIQSACVGLGMLIVTSLAGILGSHNFKSALWVNLLAFVAFVIIALCLPDQGKEQKNSVKSSKMNGSVFGLALFGFLQSVFVLSFTTNISMHISGPYAGNSQISSLIIGVFSVSQIFIGLLLGKIAGRLKHFTLPAGVFAFVPGALLLLFFPDKLPMLMLGALFCGFTQGIFMPQASTEVTNAVPSSGTTMAVAILSCGICLGQLSSPILNNKLSELLLGQATTSHVFTIAAPSMLIISLLLAVWERARTKPID